MQTLSLEALQGLSGRLFVLGLLHSLWIGLCVASMVALVFQIRPRLSHRSRHLLLLLAFFFVPAAPLVVVPIHHALLSPPSGRVQPSTVISVKSGAAGFDDAPPAATHEPAASVTASSDHLAWDLSLLAFFLSRSAVALDHLQPFLLGMWSVGSVALACFLAFAACALHGICREISGLRKPEVIRRKYPPAGATSTAENAAGSHGPSAVR